MNNSRFRFFGRLLAAFTATLLFSFGAGNAYGEPEVPNWLQSHWFTPLPPQGEPPEDYSELEASLMPEDCGTCHERQFEAWQTSRHSKAMSPGVMGQLHEPWLSKSGIIWCLKCHAPLYEQQPFINAGDTLAENRSYSKDLLAQGLSCAACHVRKHVRYGPTPKPKEWTEGDEYIPHGGFKEIPDFNRSEFCMPCHQFKPNQRKLNGKLFENTYGQWKSSRYAEKGVSCANCHMPDREHTFQGIHSQKMVSSGMAIELKAESNSITVFITNSNTGHKLPTYVTPKIAVTGVVVDQQGNHVEETRTEKAIQWMVSLSLQTEYFDTRIDPGETFKARFEIPQKYAGSEYEVEVRVYPDEFYRRFYKSILSNPPGGVDLDLIKKALEDAESSDFNVFKNRFPIIGKLE